MPSMSSRLALALFFASLSAQAASPWYPTPVEIGPLDGARTTLSYVPLAQARKPWRLCVSFPHVKDEYWAAVNYGNADEAVRQGVRMELYEAGGYDNLQRQRQQIEACAAKADAILIGAIDRDKLNDLVARLRDQGKIVVDLVNGIHSDRVHARSLVSFRAMGAAVGLWLARQHPAGTEIPIAWFPGPEGAGWVVDGDQGFRQAIAGSGLRIVAGAHGDTGVATQTRLLETALDAHPELRYIVGTAVTAEAAVKVLRARGIADRIQVLAYYFTRDVYRGLRSGTIQAAPTDSPVLQGRIAVDLAVRLLEGKATHTIVSPHILLLDKDSLSRFSRLSSLAPGGTHIIYSVN